MNSPGCALARHGCWAPSILCVHAQSPSGSQSGRHRSWLSSILLHMRYYEGVGASLHACSLAFLTKADVNVA